MNWLIYAILGIVLVGISPVFAKNGMRKCSSNLAAAIYGTAFFIAVNCALSFMDISLNLAQMGQTVFLYLLFLGLSIGMMWMCLFRALKSWKINNVIPIAKASLVFEILIGIFILRDEVVKNKIIVLILVGIGTVLMATNMGGKTSKKKTWIGNAIAAAIFLSLSSLLDQVAPGNIDNTFKYLVGYAIALIVVWVLTFASGNYRGVSSMSFLDGLYLCMSGTCIAGALYCFYKTKLLNPNVNMEMIVQFDLPAMVISSYIFLKERLSTMAVFGMLLILAGIWVCHMNPI